MVLLGLVGSLKYFLGSCGVPPVLAGAEPVLEPVLKVKNLQKGGTGFCPIFRGPYNIKD